MGVLSPYRLILALALAAAALATADYLGWRGEQRRLARLVAGAAPAGRQAELEAGLGRETVPARAAARLGWRLLRFEIDRQWLAELPESERRIERGRSVTRLRLARQLAESALARQPASWRAAAVIGATRYLEAARRDRREEPVAAWQTPLATAMRLAPGAPEPPLILASFYLSRWSSLGPAERAALPAVLERALADRRGLRRLLPAWVRVAPSLGALLEPIPDRPEAWRELGLEFLRQGDLERFAMSHQRRVEALDGHLAERAREGRARLRGGYARSGVSLLRSLLGTAPELAWADSLAVALAELPDEALTGDALRGANAWLLWARDLCGVGRCPFADEPMARLERLAGERPVAGPATSELAPRESWPAELWQQRGDGFRLPLRAARRASRLRLEVDGVPPGGAAVELAWDGRFVAVATIGPGTRLDWPLEVSAGTHLLQLRQLSGRGLKPETLTLGPDRSTG